MLVGCHWNARPLQLQVCNHVLCTRHRVASLPHPPRLRLQRQLVLLLSAHCLHVLQSQLALHLLFHQRVRIPWAWLRPTSMSHSLSLQYNLVPARPHPAILPCLFLGLARIEVLSIVHMVNRLLLLGVLMALVHRLLHPLSLRYRLGELDC